DVNAQGNQPYTIPEDNPFAQPTQLVELFGIPESEFAEIHTEARPEIWAYGLRNPWKFSFDSQTGDLYLPDVGQNEWEEINFQPADSTGGENYGWDFNMGSHCFPIEQEECPQVGVLPVAEYSHDLGLAVVGIGVYRGGEFPALDGIYFAGDYGSGRIWGLARDDQGQWAFEELLDTALFLTGAGEAEDGNLYVTSCNCEYGGGDAFENEPGALWRLVDADAVPEGAETAPLGGEDGDEEDGDAEVTGTPSPGETPEATSTMAPGETPEATSTMAPGETPEATATTAPGQAVTIQLSAENNAFSLDTITVPAGAHVVIEFTNLDTAPHNVAAYVTEAAEEEIFVGEVITGPDESITYEFDAPSEPGTYFFRCDVHPEIMVGDLIVE
ncbi:MAG TPA: PQQ-dependent sugar dehydrogenase, partial [Anaerolineae bacterium]|nr:PQQ-dependent sugar dehydrogenase [Anaerolineae bacterium]